MYRLLSLVLVSLVVVTARSLVLAEELCSLGSTVREDLCVYVSVCVESNNNLFNLLRSKRRAVDNSSFHLREPENVTSLDDFYVELLTYEDTLRDLNSSMTAYTATPRYETESQLNSVANYTSNYFNRMDTSVLNLVDTTDFMLENVSLSPRVAPNISATASPKPMDDIFAETYYVTAKMAGVLGDWNLKCNTCNSARRRRAVRRN